jgi:predicted nuclease of restriction endonuclease-like RecB superfamily
LTYGSIRQPEQCGITGQWQPEEIAWLPEQLAKITDAWEVSTDTELVNLGGEGVLVPDFVFHHSESGARIVMEVFGFWRKGAIESRLRLLRRHGPKNMILALSKALAAGQESLDELPGEVYVFRSAPVARQVLKLLEEICQRP